ncbi:MAG: acyl-ACP--UDP-N-acetylglucosamine O-acyltransferase [Bacteroidales bacterium]|nr:MAG: acyl-ACP--UDP-N-acetylglucosamine O-acyltransferase [Bacteroidales bacterium]
MNQKFNQIHADAQIGENVIIEPFTTVAGDVSIGEGTWIGPNVTIMDGARIGKNCRVFPGAVISAIPQDMKFEGEKSTTEIGDNTTIREFVTVNRGTKASYKTMIGKNCLLMAYVHIAHDCVVGNNCIIVSYAGLAGEVVLHDWVTVSACSLVHQFVHIGNHAFIGGAARVRKDVPPYIKADRDPLSYVGINSIGLKRRNFSDEKISELHEIYRTLYMKKMNIAQSLEIIEREFPSSEERNTIISFVKNSSRGIIKGY